MKNPWVVIGVIAVVLFGGAFWYSSVVTEKNNEGVVVEAHVKGNPDAAVRLVEYSDFQCPACAAFQPVVEQVLASYGDSLAFEYMHYPLPIHPYAVQAAVAAEAAGQQDKFFEYHDLLFEHQTEWSNSSTPAVQFQAYAEELGLDLETFKRHMNSSILKDHVRTQTQTGRDMGIMATPTFILNGEQMVIETYEDFIAQIAAAIDPNLAEPEDAVTTTSTDTAVEFGL